MDEAGLGVDGQFFSCFNVRQVAALQHQDQLFMASVLVSAQSLPPSPVVSSSLQDGAEGTGFRRHLNTPWGPFPGQFMLHSDQSFPDIPEQSGSTAGTGPEDKDKQT